MNNPNEFFAQCQQILDERSKCRCDNRRFFAELGRAWTAQLSIFLADQGIILSRPCGSQDEAVQACVDASFPELPGWLVAYMFAVQKLLRATHDPTQRDHSLDAVNYTWIAYDERVAGAKKSS